MPLEHAYTSRNKRVENKFCLESCVVNSQYFSLLVYEMKLGKSHTNKTNIIQTCQPEFVLIINYWTFRSLIFFTCSKCQMYINVFTYFSFYLQVSVECKKSTTEHIQTVWDSVAFEFLRFAWFSYLVL